MACMQLLTAAAVAVLLLVASPCALACMTTASTFVGSPWKPAFALFSTENAWKRHGAISRVDLFYNKQSGCLSGLRLTYGHDDDTARLLGVDRVGQATASLKLDEAELITKAEIKNGSCITFLALSTSKQQVISVGNISTASSLQTSSPASAGGFLAFVKAYTDEEAWGNLKRLQLIWATSDCASDAPFKDHMGISVGTLHTAGSEVWKAEQAHAAAALGSNMETTADDGTADAGAFASPVGDQKPSSAESNPQPADAALPAGSPRKNAAISVSITKDAACKPSVTCQQGVCPTASCTLSGMGKSVAAMTCFGTNIIPNPLLVLAGGNPCQNLACKLDKPNCTSISFLGVGGFCTGKVVAMGTTAQLHHTGKAFLGFPCIEQKGPLVDLLPFADYTAQGTYIAKAWKVCDCTSGLSSTNPLLHAPDHLTVETSDHGGVSVSNQRFPTLPQFPFFKKPLVSMTLPDVVSQWIAANEADAILPSTMLGQDQVSQIKQLLPTFTLPSIVVPKISAPLLQLPKHISLPVFKIPMGNNTLLRFSSLVPNVTSLPLLLLPKLPQRGITSNITLKVTEVTIPNLLDLASAFGVPAMPKLPSVFNMSLQDTIAQWTAAKQLALPLPQLHLQENATEAMQKVVRDFKVPCLLVTNTSLPLFRLPAPFPMPVVVINNTDRDTKAQASLILPELSAIPTFILPAKDHKSSVSVPQLTVPSITVPNFEGVAAELGARLVKSPRLPTLNWPSLPSKNISLPQLELTVPKLNFTLLEVAGFKLLETLASEQQLDNMQLNLTGLAELVQAVKALGGSPAGAVSLLDGLMKTLADHRSNSSNAQPATATLATPNKDTTYNQESTPAASEQATSEVEGTTVAVADAPAPAGSDLSPDGPATVNASIDPKSTAAAAAATPQTAAAAAAAKQPVQAPGGGGTSTSHMRMTGSTADVGTATAAAAGLVQPQSAEGSKAAATAVAAVDTTSVEHPFKPQPGEGPVPPPPSAAAAAGTAAAGEVMGTSAAQPVAHNENVAGLDTSSSSSSVAAVALGPDGVKANAPTSGSTAAPIEDKLSTENPGSSMPVHGTITTAEQQAGPRDASVPSASGPGLMPAVEDAAITAEESDEAQMAEAAGMPGKQAALAAEPADAQRPTAGSQDNSIETGSAPADPAGHHVATGVALATETTNSAAAAAAVVEAEAEGAQVLQGSESSSAATTAAVAQVASAAPVEPHADTPAAAAAP